MNLLAMLKQQMGGGMGGGMDMSTADPYSTQLAMQRAQGMSQRGQMMQDQQYQGGGSPLGVLAHLAGVLRGKKIQREGDETMSMAVKRMMTLDSEKQAAEMARAAKQKEDDYNDFVRRETAKANLKPKAQPSLEERMFESLPENLRGKAALGKFNLIPQAQAPQRVTYGQPVEMMGPNGPIMVRPGSDGSMLPIEGFRAPDKQPEALNAADVKLIQAEESRLASADNVLGIIDKLKKSTSEGVGGPIASMGLNPFTNRLTGAGQEIERYDALAATLSDEMLRLMRIPGIGSQAIAEMEQALKAIPTSDKSEATRMEILEQIANRVEAIKKAPRLQELRGGTIRGNKSATPSDDDLINKYL